MKLNHDLLKELCELASDFKQLMYLISLDYEEKIKNEHRNTALKVADDFASIFISEFVCKPSWKKLKKENTGENSIEIVWNVEDVFDLDETITVEQARQALFLADLNHDASVGINWEVLRHWIDEVKQKEGNK